MDLATGAMGSLLPKLAELLKDEYKLKKGVKEGVRSLEKEMRSMHSDLRKVAEVPRDQLDQQVRLWAGEVRELSFDMEDVIDKFLVRVDDDDSEPASKSKRLKELTEKMAGLFTKGKARHEIPDAIKDINNQVQAVANRRGRYIIDNIVPRTAPATTIDPRLKALYTEVTELVGFAGFAGKRDQKLMNLLSEGDSVNLVTGAMVSLLPKLAELLKEEYKLKKDVKDGVRSLEKEMKSMHAALRKVAEVPRDQLDEQVRLWAGEVRELSFDMEDVIDKFLVRVDDDDSESASKSKRLKELTEKMAGLFTKGKARHQIANAIKDINNQVQEVANRRGNRYMEPDVLELGDILDGRMKPKNLQLALLRNITGHFSEEREIGRGGFATVYKGVLPNGNVAVKRLKNSHTIDEKIFYHEVDSLLTINHQNIVRFLGFCASTDQMAIKIEGARGHIYAEIRERLLCFEHVRNGSLQKYITDELRGLEWDTRYQIIRGICEGLQYLHMEKHIYHMDLKPANILLDDDMVPKITDFGLSRLDEKSHTMNADRCGTLGYCAPEYQCHGMMSFKSDMYGLGIIIIELVTGYKDIPDNNKNNVLRRWRHRWKKTGKETPLGYKQVTKCIEIGLLCQEIDPCKRPFISEIISDLDKMEDTIGQVSSANESTVGQISPFSEDDMLGIEPLELYFPFELNKQMTCSLQLINDTDFYIAFKIEKMSPLLCCTQPEKGIVVPQSNCSVDITMQPRDKAPRDMRLTYEFIVRSTKVNNDLAVQDITVNMFSKETDNLVDELNLDVVFDARLQQV